MKFTKEEAEAVWKLKEEAENDPVTIEVAEALYAAQKTEAMPDGLSNIPFNRLRDHYICMAIMLRSLKTADTL